MKASHYRIYARVPELPLDDARQALLQAADDVETAVQALRSIKRSQGMPAHIVKRASAALLSITGRST